MKKGGGRLACCRRLAGAIPGQTLIFPHVVMQRLGEEVVLRSKGRVEALGAYAHGLGEVRDGGRFITLGPEQGGRRVERGVTIKRPRSAAAAPRRKRLGKG